MRYIVERSLNDLYSIIINELQGDTIGSYHVDNESALIVKDSYSWSDNNEKSISIMLQKRDDKTEMIVIGSMTSEGWLVRNTGENGNDYVSEVMNVLSNNNISLVRA